MADFDVQQVVEAAARAQVGVGSAYGSWDELSAVARRHWIAETWAAVAVIVPAVTQQIRTLHYPANRDAERTPICRECRGRAGTHPCGCWQEYDLWPVCGECGEQPTPYEDEDYPCLTVRLCDGLDDAARGDGS